MIEPIMLNRFRDYSTSIATKILLALLVGSFALWGVEDMVSRAIHNDDLATVGDENISVDTFRREYALQADQLRRSLGTSYSPELLDRLNVPQYVLQRLVQQSLLAQEAERIGFRADDATVALAIKNDPMFTGRSGGFDKSRFDSMMRAQGLSEKRYVEQLRRNISTDELLFSLSVPITLNDNVVDMLGKAQKQPRNIVLYQLNAGAAVKLPITEAALVDFHQTQASQYTTPEYRSVSYIRFTAKDAEKTTPVISSEAIDTYYNEHKDEFAIPEKREIDQLLYSDEEQAKEAYTLAKSGTPFNDIAKKLTPMNAKAISLGVVEKNGILDAAADTVFALKTGDVSEPVESPFGYHIFRVVNIQKAGFKPQNEVKTTIESMLKQQLLDNALEDFTNSIEDALAGGASLQEVAKENGLSIKSAGTFNVMGQNKSGKDAELPELEKFVEVAFKTPEKSYSSVVHAGGGEYYVLAVDELIPETLQPLETIKERVTADYIAFETNAKLASEASKIEAMLEENKPIEKILENSALKKIASGSITRSSEKLEGQSLSLPLVNAAFSTKIGSITRPVRDRSGNYLLAQVTGVGKIANNTSLTEDARDKLKQDTLGTIQEEMMLQYLRTLETRYPVSVNQDAIGQILEQLHANR